MHAVSDRQSSPFHTPHIQWSHLNAFELADEQTTPAQLNIRLSSSQSWPQGHCLRQGPSQNVDNDLVPENAKLMQKQHWVKWKQARTLKVDNDLVPENAKLMQKPKLGYIKNVRVHKRQKQFQKSASVIVFLNSHRCYKRRNVIDESMSE